MPVMSQPLRVLLIEDSADDALLLKLELEADGFEPDITRVEHRAALEQALEQAPDNGWGVVISDYNLPQFDGLEALDLVRRRAPDLPFILVSGAVGEEIAVEAMRAGAQDFILKHNLFRLAPAVRRCLAEARERILRRQAEDALRESDARFRAALVNSQVAVFEQDLELRYTWMHNPRLVDAPDDVIGKRSSDIMDADSAEQMDTIRREVMRSGQPDRRTVHVRSRGEEKWFDQHVEPKRDSKGRTIGVLCTAVEITERVAAERDRTRLSEQRQLALDSAQLGWWHYDPATQIARYDRRFADIFALKEREGLFFTHILTRVHPEDRQVMQRRFSEALDPASGDRYENEYRIQLPDGSVRWIEARGQAAFEVCGSKRRAVSMVGTVADITERKRNEEELQLAATVYRDSSEAMMVCDDDNNVIAVNYAFTQITGYASTEVVGKNPNLLKSDRQDTSFYRHMWKQISATGRYRGDVWNRKKDGTLFAAQLTVNTIQNADGRAHRYVALISDITEKKRSEDIIWSQANFDALTGLPNRRFFRERLEHEVRNARRSNLPMALMFLDLDGFKDVNDTLGHDLGDLLLKKAAERLKGCVRDIDTVARMGGDEFTVILTELHDPENADRVARHILRVLSEPIELGKETAYVSASIGITLYPQDATEIEELIKNADQAMYAAKQEGKNQYHYFTRSMQEAALYRMRLINDLRGALEDDQFEIVYQPIIELTTGKIQKAEALIRWHHPIRGLINPVEFISTAEDTGMIASFGNWVFRHAARQVTVWREKFHSEFQISVNISPVQFKKDGIDPMIWLDHLKSLDLPGQGIVVEITEGLLLDVNPKVTEQLLMLRDAGIEVALDDFGTGYSSLAYLKKFDIDYLKIDQGFVKNLTAGSDDLVLCQAIIAMAHKLGLKVIAEGVETRPQHELLANSGCDFAQGYLFSRPVSAHVLEALLRTEPFSTQKSLNL